ncbi:hypothetical protein ACFR99_11905 [Haloarchaeobius amylolyticus]|uniref:DUF7552 domain-containing protein n=1 Tax=Haloarchaeobius amylolyticus TaxID=1198296 RepID=A0ABD6BGY2_9EURY
MSPVTPETTSGTDESATPVETIRSARDTVASLRRTDGGFVVSCRESGIRPEPVTDARFDSHGDAQQACAAARRYRDAMRTLDPSLSRYDLVVSPIDETALEVASVREQTDRRRANGLPASRRTVTLAGSGSDEWLRVENGPVVHFTGPDSLLDDEVIARQLRSKLDENRG